MGFIVFKYLLSTQASMTNKPRHTRHTADRLALT
jgi:hypothetical protein